MATTTADLPREDVQECPEGTCGFSVNLWGLISPGQEHQIAAQAYDEETSTWVDLWDTPKSLTCRTYDIYTYDTLTGQTGQITTLADSHEYNPRWSPDGKRIVHDRWSPDWSTNLGVHITDVATGASTPLAGAEDGSYPTWSPNGQWIAFNDGGQLYIVPPEGGGPNLVRDDAFMASWAPNSKRLTFHQPSDESIRTMDLKGDNVVMVVDRGNSPAWSPNGKWIAFEVDGELWKVGVDVRGTPLGEPIQLTSGPAWRPSWSADSKTIAFHGGYNDEDTDIWTIPAEGGTATRLTGGPDFDDYDPNYSNNARYVAYSGYMPLYPPPLDLRVNYGHDWVESFYAAGHRAWLKVTESDGRTVKATATLVTEPKDFWGGETGFQTQPEDWDPSPPDIQPYDWVFVRVDNGVSAQVQIGDISGAIDLEADSIQGTINATWFSEEVNVECFPWGAPEPQPEMKYDSVFPDGIDIYSCSWAGEWDIQYYQDVGVGYFGPDGHWVASAFFVRNPHFTIFPEWEWFDGMEWPDGATVSISVAGKEECSVAVESWGGFFNGGFPEGCDVAVGDLVTFDDGTTIREHTVRNLAITDVNAATDTVAGTADPGAEMHVWPHEFGEYELQPTAGEDGTWLAEFGPLGFDLQEGMCGRSEIRDTVGNATAVDWCVPNPVFTAFPEQEAVEGWEWPLGTVVHLTIDDPTTPGAPDHEQDETVTLTPWGSGQLWVWFDFSGSYDMKPGDLVTLTDGVTTREHTVRNLAITTVDADTDIVAGTADADAEVFVWPHATGEQIPATADGEGAWLVDFTGVFDLVPGECGRAEIRDEVGNGTAVDWCVPPPPRILVQISDDWFEGQNFAPNAEQSYEIYDAQGGTLLLNGTMQADDRGTAGVWVGDQLDLVPGQYLVISDGSTTKELVLEALTFDVFDLTQGLLQGTAPPPAERLVWVGVGWEQDAWTMEIFTDQEGNWIADFDAPVPSDYLWAAAQVFDPDGDVSEVRPSPRSVTVGNFHVAWSQSNPEEVIYLSWSGSDNLTNAWTHWLCPDDLEFFGNSWVTENEGEPTFFQSLVGWGTTGVWSQASPTIDIQSESSGCPGPTGIPIHTTYQFFDDELKANLIAVQRVFEFGEVPYQHHVRPFIPRLYPADGFTQVLHPDGSGLNLVTRTTDDCGYGCRVDDWDGTWFAIHNPDTGLGMIVQHGPSTYPVALWVDNDGGSFTNSSSVLLLQPSGGFVGAVTETEYLCFYDSNWMPSLILPSSCQP